MVLHRLLPFEKKKNGSTTILESEVMIIEGNQSDNIQKLANDPLSPWNDHFLPRLMNKLG